MTLISFKRNESARDYEICVMGKTGPITYVGDCTVWHNMETGQRCSTSKESELSDIWSRETRRIKIEKANRDKPNPDRTMRNVTPVRLELDGV